MAPGPSAAHAPLPFGGAGVWQGVGAPLVNHGPRIHQSEGVRGPPPHFPRAGEGTLRYLAGGDDLAPGRRCPVETSAGCAFPFVGGRETPGAGDPLREPTTEGRRLVPGHSHHRLVRGIEGWIAEPGRLGGSTGRDEGRVLRIRDRRPAEEKATATGHHRRDRHRQGTWGRSATDRSHGERSASIALGLCATVPNPSSALGGH